MAITTLTNHGRLAWLNGNCSAAAEIWRKTIKMAPGDERNALWLFWLVDENMEEVIGREKLATYNERLGTMARVAGASDSAIDWYELSFDLYPS